MTALLGIASNTFREAVRDRVLYLLVFFGVLVILGSEALAVLAVGSPEKVVLDLGLAAISLFGVLVSVFLGLTLVAREIDRRTVYTVVSKPIPRSWFVLGKLAGLYGTVVLLVVGMSAIFWAFATLRHAAPGSGALKAILLSLVEDLVVASVALLFSSFTTPILGTLFTGTAWAVGHLSVGLRMLAEFPVVSSTAWKHALVGLYWALPNLERFNVRGAAVHGDPVPWSLVAGAAAYGVCYSIAVLSLAIAVFARRDLT